MEPKTERAVTSLTFGALLFAWFGVVLLWCYVPRLAAYWAESGSELSPPARMLLQLGNFVGRSVFVVGLLFILTLAAVVWRVAAVRKARDTETE